MRVHTIAIAIILICLAEDVRAQATQPNLKITPLTGDFYVFETYNIYRGNRISANGLYLVTRDGVVLIDSPWDTTQFQPLIDSIKGRHNKTVVMCLATHFHDDRTAGLEYYRSMGIKTYTTRHTDSLSQARGMQRAEFLIHRDTLFTVGQYTFQTYYPGPGHTADNIVVWFGKQKLLYGGCLIKSVADKSLGNLADANVKAYATTLKNLQKKFKRPRFIIPGHNDWTSTQSLDHSLKMAKELR